MGRFNFVCLLCLLVACVGPSPGAAADYQTRVVHADRVAFRLPEGRESIDVEIKAWAAEMGLEEQLDSDRTALDFRYEGFRVEVLKIELNALEITILKNLDSEAQSGTLELEERAQSLAQFLQLERSDP